MANIDINYLTQHADSMKYVDLSAGKPSFYNEVRFLPHGDLAFRVLYDELKAAKDEIFLVTWFLEPDLELIRSNWEQPVSGRAGDRIDTILLERAKAGVIVRILVWNFLNLSPAVLNPIVRKVNQLKKELSAISQQNEVVIVDHPFPPLAAKVLSSTLPAAIPVSPLLPVFTAASIHFLGGSHHQKFWITRSGDQLVGMVGGINLRQHDWDSETHEVLNPRRNPSDMDGAERRKRYNQGEAPEYPPRHDWMLRVEGPGAFRLLEEFQLRWKYAQKGPITLPALNNVPKPGKVFVQTSRTHPKEYGGGSTEILNAYKKAIEQAEKYIYIENQYWTTEDLTKVLAERLQKVKDLQVIIVLPDKAEDPVVGKYIAGEQWYQLTQLWKASSESRVRAYTLYRKHPLKNEYVNVYVHAKMMIVDDLWATVGSANTNNRSLLLDTECNAQIAHGPTVKAMRQNLWREVLESPKGTVDNPIEAITKGWHLQGLENKKRKERGEPLEGLIVPLKPPPEVTRLPETLRLLL